MELSCGKLLSSFPVAYQMYGKLNSDKSNTILLCHALTGDQHAASEHPITHKEGWWNHLIGSGKILDTDQYCIICPNVIGSCMGSVGPNSINPDTEKHYNLDFPVITINDMVAAQKMLIDHLGIKQLMMVIGGSMGGMQALEWSVKYPEAVFSAAIIASGARHSAQNIAFHEIGRQAIMSDPDWHQGNYLEKNKRPVKGLSIARMTAHVTYLSEQALQRKFGRSLQDRTNVTYGFEADFQVESYLRYQGNSFVNRFDPNPYLYITKAMDYYDLISEYDGILANAFSGSQTDYCVISFSSDWLFPTSESKLIVHALNAAAANVSFIEVQTDKGHDAFLLKEPDFWDALQGFVKQVSRKRRIES
ncbi:MAG: homoserine O-acetyltransferase [Rickettsiales bacterium]|nr:homoserine O-acetyltransferase [Rickettsiales bacterium]